MEVILLIGAALVVIVACESGLGWCTAVHAEGTVAEESCRPIRISSWQALVMIGPLFLAGSGLPLLFVYPVQAVICLGIAALLLGLRKICR
ncbi:hypothetical protein SAMN05660653_01997 [Desulfonatronum thiosulfatophilum]|uniref:Uncharacterized protein n=1 Tax=Desulfonatronum thiosulfatophilum TaxID=617002 RepID=A0A1G6D894_9BACT|nr:hypothetical protein [Desulfonatronum thiosulfatophilum]SDB41320.1 hypothetical protein SAMN05660653_01997 [Desulfonatronum thiosulfatophilum]